MVLVEHKRLTAAVGQLASSADQSLRQGLSMSAFGPYIARDRRCDLKKNSADGRTKR